MPTITVQIGNSDDKLTQQEWARFISSVDVILHSYRGEFHFTGGSPAEMGWQNYCWVLDLESADDLHARLADVARRFKQDSIAVTVGNTAFIGPA